MLAPHGDGSSHDGELSWSTGAQTGYDALDALAALDVSHVTPSPVCALGALLPTAAKRRRAALFVLRDDALLVGASMNEALGRRRMRSPRRHPSLPALARSSLYRWTDGAARALANLDRLRIHGYAMRVGRVGRLQHGALATLRTCRAAADRREATVGQRSSCFGTARSLQTRRRARTQHDKEIMRQQYWKSLLTGKCCSTCDSNVMAKSMIDALLIFR